MLRVFVGFDPRQPLAYTVAQHSIVSRSSQPVSITPLILRQLPITRRSLTEFTFSRYLVPWLCGYEGHALFVDADILVRGDIAELPWNSEQHAVSVVMHEESAARGVNVRFERPSVMLFNCAKCRVLTPDYIEKEKPQKLEWAESIGELKKEWNHLVGYDAPNPDARLVHFTMGLPCFKETQNDEFSDEWRVALNEANSTVSWQEIMGGSVHAHWKQTAAGSFLKAQGFR